MATGSTTRKRSTGGSGNSGRKNAGRRSTGGTKNAGSRNYKSGRSAKRSTSARTGGRNASRKAADDTITNEITLIIIIAFAALLLLSNIGIMGSLGEFISGIQYGLFGIVSFVVPVAVVITAFFYISNKGNPAASIKIWAGVVLLLILCALAQLLFPPKNAEYEKLIDYYTVCSGIKRGGGIVGGTISSVLTKGIGKVGTYIVLFVLMIIAGVMITERSFLGGVTNGGRTLYDNARNDLERLRERRENERPLREEARRLKQEEREARRIEEEQLRQQRQEERNERMQQRELERRERKEEEIRVREENLRKREEGLRRVDKKVSGVILDPGLTEEKTGDDERNEQPVINDNVNYDIHEIKYVEPEKEAGPGADYNEPAENTPVDDVGMKELHYEEPLNVSRVEYGSVKTSHSIAVDTKGMEAVTADPVRTVNPVNPVNPAGAVPVRPYRPGKAYNTSELESAIINETMHLSSERDYDRPIAMTNIHDNYGSFYSDVYNEDKLSVSPVSERIAEDEPDIHVSEPEEETVQEIGYSDTTVEAYEMPSVTIDETEYKTAAAQKHVSAPLVSEKASKSPVREFRFPPLSMLKEGKKDNSGDSKLILDNKAIRLQETLKEFGVGVTMTGYTQGPAITRFEMKPDVGVKVSKVLNLSDDIMLSMAAKNVRIEAPIPGKALIGIELPNEEISAVMFRDLIESREFRESESKLSFAVGKGLSGETVVADIGKMPHLLIAGATGSGKSVCINTLIMSILYKARPDEVKLIMVDPKVVELSVYNGIPHLMIPVVTDPKQASEALKWGVVEMDDRYNKFAEFGVRDLNGYNKKVKSMTNVPEQDRYKVLPRIVIIVDELADLMMVASKEVEESICRIAQKARAAGIHLVIATQRPSVDVVTGLIKANMPSRIAFSVSSSVDSRTILDMVGAEKLLGKGDMLFYPQGYTKPARVQGPFVSDQEVSDVVDFLKEHTGGDGYDEDIARKIRDASSGQGGSADTSGGQTVSGNGNDELFVEAAKVIIEKNKASIGMLQRMFKIGFNRAARIMDQLADAGVVGEEEGTKPRKVLMSLEQLEAYIEEYL